MINIKKDYSSGSRLSVFSNKTHFDGISFDKEAKYFLLPYILQSNRKDWLNDIDYIDIGEVSYNPAWKCLNIYFWFMEIRFSWHIHYRNLMEYTDRKNKKAALNDDLNALLLMATRNAKTKKC